MKINAVSLGDPDPISTADPKPIHVSTCTDLFEINFNGTLLAMMKEHLHYREAKGTDDTAFERWIHGQLCSAEFNNY